MEVVVENASTEAETEKMPSCTDTSKQTNESNKLSEKEISENISVSASNNLPGSGQVKDSIEDGSEPVDTDSVNKVQSEPDKIVEDIKKHESNIDSNQCEKSMVVEETEENQPAKDENITEDKKSEDKSSSEILDKSTEKVDTDKETTIENVKTDKKENPVENPASTKDIEEIMEDTHKEVVENNTPEEKIEEEQIKTNDEVKSTNESKPAEKTIKNSAILESIASDWCFSDVENDTQECPAPTPPVKTAKTDQEPKKTSAEMIAMEWDDSSQTAAEETTTDKKSDPPKIEKPLESDIQTKNTNASKPDSEEKTIICTVVENKKDEKSSTNEENIIILHDLSELNLDPSQNSGITIISVDENPNVPDSDVNKSSDNSYVIHEISIDTTDSASETTPKKIEEKSKTKGRKSKYPYVICTKEEITQELSQLKPTATDQPAKGDIIFKNQILKRLASKILPKNVQTNDAPVDNTLPEEKPSFLDTLANTKPKTVSDQELLEILEGDADIDIYNLPKEEHVTIEKLAEISPPRSKTRYTTKQLDPETEREIALQQLSEIPEGDYRGRGRKGKNNNVVATNVPSTIIIEKAEKTEADPFTFVENTKTVGTPSAYGPGTVKTYSRKSVSNEKEPNMKEIVQTIPKEILELEKEASKPPRKNAKGTPGNKKQSTDTPKSTKKKSASESKAPEKQVKKQKSDNNKIFLTDNTNNVLISKRSRIIKKKIIWDPSLKFPTYVMPTITKGKVQKPKDQKHIIPKKKLKSIGNAMIKEESLTEKKENVEIPPEDNEKEVEKTEVVQATKDVSEDRTDVSNKRKSEQTQKKKKRFKRYATEIDKLLMDEGALNMLYSVEQDEKVPLIREKQKVISLDKFSKEMNKKKKMIMTALNTSPEGTPKALRKKDSIQPTPTNIPPRKQSRDSVRSPANTPPPSPNSMFPPRAEASRIIRRHSSSSSFSSECMSPRRLSAVEVTTTEQKPKVENEKAKGSVEKPAEPPEKLQKTETNERPQPKKMKTMKMAQSRNLRRRGVPIFIKKNPVNVYTGSKSKYLKAKESDKKDENKPEKEDSASEQKVEKSSEKTEVKENEVTAPKSGPTKQYKKDSVRSSSPTTESYSNVVKQLDTDKKKEIDEKQRTSSRQNAGMYNYKEISIKRYDELVQIILTPQSTKIKNALNIQTMKEICDVLSSLKKDASCKVILITSTGSIFCRGLDYTPLIQPTAEKRKAVAQEMANAVKDFVRAIMHFPRPVVAGVQGAASGLGVAILPLCDLVLVSDKAIFSMNQCKLGCLPEGAATVSLPYVTSHAVAAELLIAGHTLTANEALRAGLASRVLWPEGYFQELIPACKAIATQSSQSMDATKALTRHPLVMKIEAALDSETHLLVQHWTSSECQQLLKKALEQDAW